MPPYVRFVHGYPDPTHVRILWPASLCKRLIHTSNLKCHDGVSVRTLSRIWLLLDLILFENLILRHTLPLLVTLSDLQHRVTLPQCVLPVSQDLCNEQYRPPIPHILRINLLTFVINVYVLQQVSSSQPRRIRQESLPYLRSRDWGKIFRHLEHDTRGRLSCAGVGCGG